MVHVFRRPMGSKDGLHSLIILTLLNTYFYQGMSQCTLRVWVCSAKTVLPSMLARLILEAQSSKTTLGIAGNLGEYFPKDMTVCIQNMGQKRLDAVRPLPLPLSLPLSLPPSLPTLSPSLSPSPSLCACVCLCICVLIISFSISAY
jgi:hypothetical protein